MTDPEIDLLNSGKIKPGLYIDKLVHVVAVDMDDTEPDLGALHFNYRNKTADQRMALVHVLWTTPEQRMSVRKMVGKVSNPISETILQHQDAAVQMARDLERGVDKNGNKVDEFEIATKMKDCYVKLEKMVDKKKPNKRLDQALAKVKGMYFKIAQDHLKIDLCGIKG